ncbi:MAG: hypothetical protein ACYS8I_11925 [Planctomycetota bacterium]|jgi:hypothetical protein
MFQTTFLTGLAAIIGAAGSIVLMPFVGNIAPQLRLAIAASLGAVCSSILVCRENSLRRKLGKAQEGKKSSSAKLRVMLFWVVLICGLAAVAIAGLKMSGRL